MGVRKTPERQRQKDGRTLSLKAEGEGEESMRNISTAWKKQDKCNIILTIADTEM